MEMEFGVFISCPLCYLLLRPAGKQHSLLNVHNPSEFAQSENSMHLFPLIINRSAEYIF